MLDEDRIEVDAGSGVLAYRTAAALPHEDLLALSRMVRRGQHRGLRVTSGRVVFADAEVASAVASAVEFAGLEAWTPAGRVDAGLVVAVREDFGMGGDE
ncbi:MAG: hypothetical protein H6698_01335 [Myxococcales bacterium]|nr:hypothetical protein [Myxococcales bacterium]MCB9531043.1 hypothetical protein [Myxococcales bacterium]MCB9532953.1 hypothetical protein [Myxococcales bacterium]